MAQNFAEFEQKCKASIDHFKQDLGKLRTGRASASMLDVVFVDYYGSSVQLKTLGMINTPEPRLITVQVFDGGAVDAVEKAIKHADLGLNPQRDGNLIRVPVPSLTEERRKDLIKKLHKMSEDGKVVIRNLRRDAIDSLKKQQKNGEVSEDDLRKGQEQIQKITDKYIAEVDVHLAAKEKEMMEV
jgi:ribosome recycling factor